MSTIRDVAKLANVSTATVSRILNKWSGEGLIEMHRKEFVIHDMSALLHKIIPQP